MRSLLSFFVAYDRDRNNNPVFLPVLPPPVLDPIDDPGEMEQWIELMEVEGAFAARVLRGTEVVVDRTFPPLPPDAPETYMVTHPYYTSVPFSATLEEIRGCLEYTDSTFVAVGNCVLGIEHNTIRYAALRMREYRRRAAGVDGPGVPVCPHGDFIPEDGTYVYITDYHPAYRAPLSATADDETVRVTPFTRSVIPFVEHRPLWAARTIDTMMELGEERAIAEAQSAIAAARTVRSYDEREHLSRLIGTTDSQEEGQYSIRDTAAIYRINRRQL